MWMELKKALHGKNFWVSLSVGCLLTIFHAIWVADYLNTSFVQRIEENGKNAYFIANPSFMQGWIGMDVFSAYGNLFYVVIFPLLAALPYATSIYHERKLGYDKQMIVRCGKKRYFFVKYLTTFIVAGIAVTVPAVLSLGIAMTYLPLIPMESFMYQTGVSLLWVNIFYSKPLLYVILYMMVDFAVAGTLGIVSLSFTFFAKSNYMILILPTIMNLLFAESLSSAPNALRQLISYLPYAYAHPGQIAYYSGWHICVSLVVLTMVSCGCAWYQIRTQDILS